MIAARSQRRSGITLTEILIAILIMGVGLISLATLFPLGLIRLREATRQGRAGTTFESAADDVDARSLLFKPSFRNTWYGLRDPFVQDADANGVYFTTQNNVPVGTGIIASGSLLLPANNVDFANPYLADGMTPNPSADGNPTMYLRSGLPICYDPLWRSLTGVLPIPQDPPNLSNSIPTYAFDPTVIIDPTFVTGASPAYRINEARFGSGLFAGATPPNPYIQADPDGGLPSAHGFQRLTNFVPWNSNGLTPQYAFTCTNLALAPGLQPGDVSGNVFTSVDDIVFNTTEGNDNVMPDGTVYRRVSSVLPDMSSGGPQADYRFTWFFTGRQIDANGNGGQFTGEIVVCDGRPFGFDPLPGQTVNAPAGETVVEAMYGYLGNPKAVLLRWNSTLPDPPLRVGGWICDTTYERSVPLYRARVANAVAPFVRCNWYQIAKRIDPTADPTYAGYRSTVVTLASPVRATTSYNASTGKPIHLNVALIMPSVINVFPRSFEVQYTP